VPYIRAVKAPAARDVDPELSQGLQLTRKDRQRNYRQQPWRDGEKEFALLPELEPEPELLASAAMEPGESVPSN
jgi:hypothetical protein